MIGPQALSVENGTLIYWRSQRPDRRFNVFDVLSLTPDDKKTWYRLDNLVTDLSGYHEHSLISHANGKFTAAWVGFDNSNERNKAVPRILVLPGFELLRID